MRTEGLRHVLPWRSLTEHPQNPVEHGATIRSRAAATIAAHSLLRKDAFDILPLTVGHTHAYLLYATDKVTHAILTHFAIYETGSR